MFRLVGLIALAVAVNAPSSAQAADPLPQSGAGTIDTAQIERGRYIAKLGDCAACHNAEGGAPHAGGRPIVTPFGIIYSANITTDKETGIGAWTNDEFWTLMHSGIRKGGGHVYPAMPYPWFTKMTRQEVDDLKAYLNTFPPVRYRPPKNELLPPLQFRETVAAWNLLFFDKGVFKPDPSKSTEWNRGAYIVEGPGHCGACHTPANLLGGPERDRLYEGHSIENWWAPDLTGRGSSGVAAWSKEDIVAYLKTGRNNYAVASGPMALAVENSTQYMTATDLAAIATYLKDLPIEERERDGARVGDASTETMTDGGGLFRDNCAACHGSDGAGVPSLISDLRQSGVVNAADPAGILRVILSGADGNVTQGAPTRPAMPPFDWKLDDSEIAAVATYVRQSFGNRAQAVSGDDVADLRETLRPPFGPWWTIWRSSREGLARVASRMKEPLAMLAKRLSLGRMVRYLDLWLSYLRQRLLRLRWPDETETVETGVDQAAMLAQAPFGSDLYRQCLALRDASLRKPLGLTVSEEECADDMMRQHFCAIDDGAVVACLSLKPLDGETLQLKQMAVAQMRRGSRLGARLLAYAEAWAEKAGYRRIVVPARIGAEGFYAKFGYMAEGEPFDENTVPHIQMTKTLADAAKPERNPSRS